MKAIIRANKETGNVVTRAIGKESGKEYGTFMVQQTVLTTENGFLVPKNRCAFIRIANEHLDAMESMLNAGDEYTPSGRIQRVESYSPQYDGHKAKITPGKDGAEATPYLLNGQSVYFTDTWNSDAKCQDVLLVADVMAEVNENVSAEAEA